MPKISKDTATTTEWHEDVEGYKISFVAFNVHIDSAPLVKGLPNDECTCPHRGYVLKAA
jgi:hypothetical protein